MYQIKYVLSELTNITELVHVSCFAKLHGIKVYTSEIDDILFEYLKYDDLQSADDMIKIVKLITEKILKHQIHKHDMDEIENTWGNHQLQLARLPRKSNLFQWLLEWYDNDATTLEQSIKNAYLTNDALYFSYHLGNDLLLDVILLNGDGSNQMAQQFKRLIEH